MQPNIVIPEYAHAAINLLEEAGYEAWCVGGCVRDALLGRAVNDYDITTSAPCEETKRIFEQAGWKTHDTGIKHGTVTVVHGHNAFEITTYRSDGAYSDGRHPDKVSFVNTIEEDLARRDFTINALAYHPERGLLDCYEGLADLESKRIRAIGDAGKRFSEDALRILRACRFASQLGFSIDEGTMAAMDRMKTFMLHVSKERITAELQAFLLGDYVHDALMETVDILGAVLPELVAMKGFEQHTPYHIYDVLEHTAYVVQHTQATPLNRWAALFHDVGKPGAYFNDNGRGHFYGHALISEYVAKGALARLSLSPSFVNDVVALVRIHDDIVKPSKKAVKRTLMRLDGRPEMFSALCDLKRADALSQAPQCHERVEVAEQLAQLLDEVLADDEAFTLNKLAVNGHDLMSLGVKPGPQMGELLDSALEAVVDERVANDHDELLAFLAEQLS